MKRATLRSFLALVAFFGLRCAPVIAQTQTAVFTYYVTVPLTLGSCVGSNPIFSTASLYCGTGTFTATYEPSCMNISPTNVTFAGANYRDSQH